MCYFLALCDLLSEVHQVRVLLLCLHDVVHFFRNGDCLDDFLLSWTWWVSEFGCSCPMSHSVTYNRRFFNFFSTVVMLMSNIKSYKINFDIFIAQLGAPKITIWQQYTRCIHHNVYTNLANSKHKYITSDMRLYYGLCPWMSKPLATADFPQGTIQEHYLPNIETQKLW